MSPTTAVKDPVCGMDVDQNNAPAQSEHEGHTHYFCGNECKQKFDNNPSLYENKSHESIQANQGGQDGPSSKGNQCN
jgi:YHS domain-containing protein